jgi:hypothetical protein
LPRALFSGLISGPASIPRLYNGHNRSFFMFSWETQFNPYAESYLGKVPSAAKHDGNFAGDVSNIGVRISIRQ